MSQNIFIVIVTGVSGGGKTVTLRTLEDMGFFCVDNLPPPIVLRFLEMLNEECNFEKIAFGIDIRVCSLFDKLVDVLKTIKQNYSTEILFLEAEEEIILRRYKETRRPHPLSLRFENLQDAIRQERVLLYPIREISDKIIDTSEFNPHELKAFIRSIYGQQQMHPLITVMSFGYKKGIPMNADLVFDARFLPNPYFIPSLSSLTGKDSQVKDFVLKQKETLEFLSHIKNFLNFVLPGYQKEGRAYLTIAIGCTGGRHRSVVLAEEVFDFLKSLNLNSVLIHRDL